LDITSHAAQRHCRQDALRRSARAQQHIDARFRHGRHQGTGHIPIRDQTDAGPHAPHLGNQGFMTGSIQDDHSQVIDIRPLGPGDGAQVHRNRGFNVNHIPGFGAHGNFFHVNKWTGIEHGPPRRQRHGRD